jgi:O-succinylbenzoic acid--CoA ligase
MLNQSHPILSAIDQNGDAPALIIEQKSVSYADLGKMITDTAYSLKAEGISSGDILVLDDLEPLDFIVSYWASAFCGSIAFPLNTRFPQESLHQDLMELNPKVILSNRVYPNLEVKQFDQLIPGLEASLTWDLEQPATMLKTSGSSGVSKIVVHNQLNHLTSALGSNRNIVLSDQDSWMLSLPLYHVGGLSVLYRTALAGASVSIPDPIKSLTQNLADTQATHISLVPTQLQRILNDPDGIKLLRETKAILVGGSSVPQTLIEQALDHALPLFLSYGSTEMSSQICTTNVLDRKKGLGHAGRPLFGREIIISHEGEILVRGDTLALGYLKDSSITELRDREGWFHTGDVGYIEADGSLTVTGRIDNQFISGGENIQPEHIERLLMAQPGINLAIVVPRSDDNFGARPIAFLSLENSSLDISLLNNLLRKSLPGYMIPDQYYHFPDDLNTTGIKISRNKLTDYLIGENNHLQSIN